MASVRWIKIITDIFDDEKMAMIETLPDGYTIEVVWFKLLCVAGKCNNNGFLMISDKFPYTIQMLSKVFRMEIGIVQRALEVFECLEMINIVDNVYCVSNWDKHQSADRLDKIREKDKLRQREHREKKKLQLIEVKNTKDENSNIEEKAKCHSDSHYDNNYDSHSDTALYSNIFNSNNSNIYNFNILLNVNDYIYIKENEKLLKSISEFMEYKDNKKPKSSNHYDTELGMRKLLNKIVKYAKDFGVEAVASVIDETISNNWQGIVWDRFKNMKPIEKPKPIIKQEIPKIEEYEGDDW